MTWLHLCSYCKKYLIPFEYNKEDIGTERTVLIYCPSCGKSQQVSVHINTDFTDYPLSWRFREG